MAKENIESRSANLTIISQGTAIEGIINSNGNLRLDGQFKGQIQVEGNIVIGKEGIVQAEIHCHTLTIAGKIRGNLYVQEQVILEKEAVVIGDIQSRYLIVNEGAVFHGYNKITNLNTLQQEWKDDSKHE